MTQAAAIPRICLKEMGTNRPWKWRLTALKTIKMMLGRPRMTNVKMTVSADCAVSECSPLRPSIKALAHWLSVGGSRPLDRSPPLPLVAGIWNKANFPFHQPCLFIGFWTVSGLTPLSVTQWLKIIWIFLQAMARVDNTQSIMKK